MIELQAELVLESHATVAEGPVWDADREMLWWVDIPEGEVHAFDPHRMRDMSYLVGSPVGAVALRHDGTLLIAAQDSFASLDPATGRITTIAELAPEPRPRRANDGKCDPRGRFLVGRMAADETTGVGGLTTLGIYRAMFDASWPRRARYRVCDRGPFQRHDEQPF